VTRDRVRRRRKLKARRMRVDQATIRARVMITKEVGTEVVVLVCI
jgi:hypothetical protein